MVTTWMFIAVLAGYATTSLWGCCGLVIQRVRRFGGEPGPTVRAVFWELRPFYLPATVVVGVFIAAGGGQWIAWAALNMLANIAQWYRYKDVDDDDRWKRRRRRAVERIERAGARLVVVPEAAR